MITTEEKQQIVDEVMERILLSLPELIGNLMTSHMALLKMNREFYKNNVEFAKHKDVVASVVEKVEGDNPGMNYNEILKKAVPLIKERLNITSKLNIDSVSRPSRNLDNINFNNNGEL